RELTRISWAKESVSFARVEEPLRYRRAATWLAGTHDCALDLDALGVPVDASTTEALKALRTAKKGRRREVVLDALRSRRERAA
ncbi:MAG: hypothetical protein KDB35_20500, partial [Acidimicrobiales bacterium]|nr:hypothetical protein [Acidimicrobiales bacterium]